MPWQAEEKLALDADRDLRTVFVYQLSVKASEDDVFNLMSQAGRVSHNPSPTAFTDGEVCTRGAAILTHVKSILLNGFCRLWTHISTV